MMARPCQTAGEPADRGDPGAFDHAGPELGDEAESLEEAAEDGQQHQEAGHEDLVGLGVGADLQGRLQQGREEQQVHHRLEDPDEDPDRVAEEQAEVPVEDQ